MKSIKRIISSFLIIGIFVFVPSVLFAQVDPCTDPADPCPIDSGLLLLIGVAILIAIKKAFEYKKKLQY